MAAPAEVEAVEIDERFEYDAPRFYDFDEGSPAGAEPADGWFDTEGPKGERGGCFHLTCRGIWARAARGERWQGCSPGNNNSGSGGNRCPVVTQRRAVRRSQMQALPRP